MAHAKSKIYNYWKNSPLKSSLNQQAFNGDGEERCMACGVISVCDRAHIVSDFNNGSNDFSNLHCLCRTCHTLSEVLEGHDYWLWIALKSLLFEHGTDMTVEIDLINGEEKILPCTYDYSAKLKKYGEEYTALSMLETFQTHSSSLQSYFVLLGVLGPKLKINYPNLDDIADVMEVQEDKDIHFYLNAMDRLEVNA